MSQASTTTSTSFTVTPRAFMRLEKVMAQEPEGSFLRLSVEGGGCSGFQYVYKIDHNIAKDDHVITNGQQKVVVDDISLGFLAHAELDYVDELIGASFQIKNPNAVSSCGCGVSFHVA